MGDLGWAPVLPTQLRVNECGVTVKLNKFNTSACMSFQGAYVAVHGGAGVHSHIRSESTKRALRLACVEALKSYDAEEHVDAAITRLDMVRKAIASLEDDHHLNAGYGSNLTLDGTVECDAAIMDGPSGDFGSVGAVSGVKNPIQLAYSILRHSQLPDPLGRIPPLSLVSEGARAFAAVHGAVQMVPPESLITPQAKDEWGKWKDHLTRSQKSEIDFSGITDVQDTVGAVACRYPDGVAAGVSSGGILLKFPGRIGEAAMFGAGCWAQQFKEAKIGIACSVSGTGEYIARSMLARAIGEEFRTCILKGLEVDSHDIIHRIFTDKLLEPCRQRGISNPDAGVLLLVTEEIENKVTARIWCAFTTSSMAIAYASSLNPKPKALILRHPKSSEANESKSRIFITAVSL